MYEIISYFVFYMSRQSIVILVTVAFIHTQENRDYCFSFLGKACISFYLNSKDTRDLKCQGYAKTKLVLRRQ